MPRHLGRYGLLLASAVLVLLGPATDALAQARHKLTQAGFRVLYMAPAFIALEKGIFAQEGVDFTFTELDSGALGAAAVISGNAQISDLDPLGIARLQQEGKPMLLVYNLVGRVTLDLIVRTAVAQRLGLAADTPLAARYAALKGLTIGITRPGAPTDVFARYFLVRAGLNPDRDATLVQVGGVPALAAAFKSERIDAFLLSPPLPQTLEREGVGRIDQTRHRGRARPALQVRAGPPERSVAPGQPAILGEGHAAESCHLITRPPRSASTAASARPGSSVTSTSSRPSARP
jgi:NitT/TauT family transport system substrate-binding protein